MSSQLVLWTAVPNGTAPNGNLRVSVHVAPRLTPSSSPGTLGHFPDWLHWPAVHVGWHLKINGVPHPATQVSSPDLALYRALFPSTVPVSPYQYQSLAGQKVHSYPVGHVRQFFKTTYSSLAVSHPGTWPAASYLLDGTPFADLPPNDDRELSLIDAVLRMFPREGGPVPPAASPRPATDLLQAKLFLQPKVLPPKGSSYPLPRPGPPDIDFQKAVGLIGRHPALQRLFGFVYDLELARPAGPLPPVINIEAVPSWSPHVKTTNVTPLMSTTWASWLPAPRASHPELHGGFLRLSDPEYLTIEMDLDGASLKALDFVKNFFNATGPMRSTGTPTNYATPSLRSAGLSLARTANAQALYGALQTGDANNAQAEASPPGIINLAAEDVTQGYRIDVWDSVRKKWFQLCARTGATPGPGGYVIGAPGHTVPVPNGDEGWVELGMTSSGAPAKTDQFIPETLMRWAGWSLVAPRIGSYLSYQPSDGLTAGDHNAPTGTFQLQVTYMATPSTLPVLRFGRAYRFRARSVDIAGNSVAFSPSATAASFKWAPPPAVYGRLEPVATPFVVPTAPRTPGEHLERIVIRSNYDIPDTSPKIRHSSRHIVPPVTSVEMAEQHGVLDTSAGVPDPSRYPKLAALDGLTYSTPSVIASLGGKSDTQPMNNGSQSVYYPVDQLAVPYMPDPIARGATLQSLPGVPAVSPPTKVPFKAGKWPQVDGFRIDVGPGPGAPELPSAANSFTLSVHLPKATFQTVRLSSYFRPTDLAHMLLWRWLLEAGKGSVGLARLIASGRHWMFTPYREVVLVHAVRQPLVAPSFKALFQARTYGDTFTLLTGSITCDPPSTSRLDVVAQWTDPFDDGTSATGSVPLLGNSRVGELSVSRTGPKKELFRDLRHDFGDTKHHNVYYEARATTAFLEYFTETVDVTLSGTAATAVATAFAPGTVRVSGTGSLAHEVYTPNIDYKEDDATGHLARLVTGGIASGATVEVQYVNPPIIRSSLEADAHPPTPEGNLISVPSTARPPVPDVRYILPAFAWTASTTPTPTSVRRGHILRVYLGRPWWQSGPGELLGVVLADPPPGAVLPSPLQPFVTGYGRDPLFVSGNVKAPPALGDFPLAVAAGKSLILAEQTGTVGFADVAGHQVQWDPDRKLWFSDIEINVGNSYWPFVKLALVRYQPASLSGVEMSRVVQADFIQLGASRTATLTFPTANTVQVTVSGESYLESFSTFAPSIPDVRAWVETELTGVPDPDLRWAVTPTGDPGTRLVGKPGPASTTTWTGTVTLPAPRGSQPLRILIGEREVYVQFQSGDPTLRTTYLDTIEI